MSDGSVQVQRATTENEYGAVFESAGCICLCGDRILFLKRRGDRSYPGVWGLPSGKVERGESRERTVLREVYEETGLIRTPTNLSYLGTCIVESNTDLPFLYTVYLTKYDELPHVEITQREHTEYEWIPIHALSQYQLVPGTIECLEVLAQDLLASVQPTLFDLDEEPGRSTATSRPRGKVDSWITTEDRDDRPDLANAIVVIGPPGVGKSTLVKKLAKANEALMVAHYNILQDRSSRQHMYLDRFLRGDDSYALRCQVEALASRYWSYLSARPRPNLLDEWIFSTLAYSKALRSLERMTEDEFQTFYVTYASYVSFLTPPKLVIHLTTSAEELRRRIVRRKRDFEQSSHREAYLSALATSFAEVARELLSQSTVLTLDTTGLSRAQVATEVIARARQLGVELS